MKTTDLATAKATGERAAKVLVPSNSTEHEFMTAAEVADLFRVTRQCITRLARAGKLPGVRIGTNWRFNRSEMLKLGRVDEGGPVGGSAA